MRVGANALPAADRTGIGGFTRAVLRALRPQPDLRLVTLGGEHPPADSTEHVAMPRWSDWFEQLHLEGYLRNHRIDVYYSPVLSAPIACSVPVVITIHDAIPCTHPSLTTPEFARYWDRWVAPSLRAATRVVTVSQAAKRDLIHRLEIPADKVCVVRQSVGPRMKPSTPADRQEVLARHGLTDQHYALFVGGLDERKNLTRLVQAFAIVAGKHDLTLAVVGPAVSATLDVSDIAAAQGIGGRVKLLGHVDGGELPALYGGAALFAFPSLAEGFGRPVLEAMSCGAPVVTSAIPALEELAGGAALHLDPEDVEGLADAMGQLLDNPALAGGLRRRGLQRATHFGDAVFAADLLEVFTAALEVTV